MGLRASPVSVCFSSKRRRGFCDFGHQRQLRQGRDGARPVVTEPQHEQEAGCARRPSRRRTLQVSVPGNAAAPPPLENPRGTDHPMRHREALQSIFDEVCAVDVMDSGDAAHLTLMKRPDLGVTFTKLHCWTLTHYSKCVFMDADTLVRNETNRPLKKKKKKKTNGSAEIFANAFRFWPTSTSCSRGRSCLRRRILVGPTASTPACLFSGRPTRLTRSCWSSAARTAALTVI